MPDSAVSAAYAMFLISGVLALYFWRAQRKTAALLSEAIHFENILLERSADCIAVLDHEGRIASLSQRGFQVVSENGNRGRTGEPWTSWWLPPWIPAAQESLRRAQEGMQVTVELCMESASGDPLWWETVLLKVPERSSTPAGIVAIMRETTDRKHFEAALRESEERFTAFVEYSPALVYIKDANGRYLVTNKIYEELRGSVSGGLLGRTDQEALGYDLTDEVGDLERSVLKKGVPRRAVEAFNLSNGEQMHWRVLRFPLRLSSDKLLLGAIGVDVTRTVLAEAELQVARDAALQSAKLKSEFLANMSHEIRTPMNGVIGMARLLLETNLSHRQRDFAQTISSSADALLTILDDVLDFSKIEAGMLTFESINFDLEEVIYGTVKLLAERAENKGLELSVICHPDVPLKLKGDPGRLRQILMNLLGNALKFTQAGEVVLECELDTQTAAEVNLENPRLVFRVRDTGIGISQEAQKILFKAFSQADGSTTRRYGGTGLGLAISRELVHRMKGEIGLSSVEGKGSVFWFTAEFRPSAPDSAESTRAVVPLDDCLFLLAAPSAFVRRGLALALNARGAQVKEFSNGGDLLLWLKDNVLDGVQRSFLIIEESIGDHVLGKNELANALGGRLRVGLLAPFNRVALTPFEAKAGCETLFTKPLRTSTLDSWISGESRTAVRENQNFQPISNAGKSKHNRLTFLVAEDNAVNQSVIRHQLESLGHDLVFMASNGKALLEGLTTYEGDAILMDCQMPDMDGYAATQAIRAMEAAGRSPWGDRKCWIIAMTANTMEGDREHCISAGMDDYTSKPVKESELRQVLSRIPARTAVSTQSSILGRRFPVVSARALASLRELGGPTGDVLLQTLVGQFLESGQKLLDDIQQAWSQGDTSKLRLGVHTLQGSAANFGAQSLVHVCVRAEQAVTEEHFENISKAVALIPHAFDEVRIALKEATAAVRDQSLI